MSNTRNDQETQAMAEERKKREYQEAIDRLAKANAMKVLLPPPIYTFERIDDAAEIQRLKDEKEKAFGGDAISSSPSVVTNIDDKDGTFKVYKDGEVIPGELIYVRGGVVSSSVNNKDFKQEHADRLIAKALEMGKDLILNVGSPGARGGEHWINEILPKLTVPELNREMAVLDKLIIAGNNTGQPYKLGAQSRALLGRMGAEVEEKYLKAEVVAAGNSISGHLVSAMTRDGNLNENKKKIEEQVKARDPKSIDDVVAALGSPEEKLAAIRARLDALSKSADVSEAAAKEIKGSVEGAEKLLDKFLEVDPSTGKEKGAALFHNVTASLDATSQEERIQKADAALDNLTDRFDPASSSSSTRADLQGAVEVENNALKAEADACQQAVVALEKAEVAKLGAGKTANDLDPDMQKQMADLKKQASALDKRVDGMEKANAEVDKKVKDIPVKLKKALGVLDENKDEFQASYKRSPAPR